MLTRFYDPVFYLFTQVLVMQGSPLSVYPQSCGMGKLNKADDDDKKVSPSCQGRIYVANEYLTFTRSISIFSRTFRIS